MGLNLQAAPFSLSCCRGHADTIPRTFEPERPKRPLIYMQFETLLKTVIILSICAPAAYLSKSKLPARQTILNNEVGLCQETISDTGSGVAVSVFFCFCFLNLRAGLHSHALIRPIISKQRSLAKTAELGSIQVFQSN